MTDEENDLRDLINKTGFLFQLRVEHELRKTQRTHRWEIIGSEHRWVDPDSGREGFIDLILSSGFGRLVIECKRVQDTTWTFLLPDGEEENESRARLLWMYVRSPYSPAFKRGIYDWTDFAVPASSPESSFCIIRGQDKDRPMLERLSGIVLKSLESVAQEEWELSKKSSEGKGYLYIPLIVTTAELRTCKFNLDEVDLKSGQFLNDNAYF